MSSAKKERKLHKAGAMLMLTACVWGPMGMGIAQADVEDTVIVPNRVILIKKGDHQGERDLHIRGTGSAPIFIIGGEYNPAGGAASTVDLNKPNSFVDIYGGYHDGYHDGEVVNVTNNIVNVDTGVPGWLIYDDPQKIQDSEHYNKLKITSPSNKLAMNVIAGHVFRGEASGNVINLNGGVLADYVIAAETQDYDDGTGFKVDEDAVSRLHDNTVNINANMELAAAKIYGAAVFHQADRSRTPFMGTNNTLNTYVKDQQVGELGGFNTYNFYLPQGTKSGDTLVTVVGGNPTVISASTVRGIVEKTGSLPFGSTVNLLVNASGVTAGAGTIYQGIHKDTGLSTGDINSKLYELVVYKADSSHVVLIFSGADAEEQFDRLDEALTALGLAYLTPQPPARRELPEWETVCSPRAAVFGPHREVILSKAEGMVAAQQLAPYPPGVPVVAPGERITKKHLEYLAEIGYNKLNDPVLVQGE